jgi:tRNA U38,U39,U40 pseudouridine synthase TruA
VQVPSNIFKSRTGSQKGVLNSLVWRPPAQVQGTGFLYKQVRHMTGALLAVGQGKMGLDHIQQLLEIGSSQAPGAGGGWRGYNVAPAKGLQLFEVAYPPTVDDPTAILYPEYQRALVSDSKQ